MNVSEIVGKTISSVIRNHDDWIFTLDNGAIIYITATELFSIIDSTGRDAKNDIEESSKKEFWAAMP